jgi:hypothetical protein
VGGTLLSNWQRGGYRRGSDPKLMGMCTIIFNGAANELLRKYRTKTVGYKNYIQDKQERSVAERRTQNKRGWVGKPNKKEEDHIEGGRND